MRFFRREEASPDLLLGVVAPAAPALNGVPVVAVVAAAVASDPLGSRRSTRVQSTLASMPPTTWAIGTRFFKEFEGIIFTGRIAGYKRPYYQLEYSDGDSEDVTNGDASCIFNTF